ncbi:3-oxoacyl-[acyl-carrier-protein] synthase II [Streptomyces umbrinus]|uniref:3-oxoacyl-[acyl-carrier-protein] synthase II n=1 Tax=Streptomyces umbrinus TaxID=67370 RepID=A0ABU0STT5_9ACTN|nr:beta-ketoacyl synthase N-terminal-like domain-containing protein [Streptomyces umbrinus]MDQ1026957.1 3-oxoacyl-[acyl-carrier-protein] synthase II [Streptomyces umbrinus]
MSGVSAAELAVTGVGVVSPWGDSAEAAVVAGGSAMPGAGEWFSHRERLGRRGYKYLPAAAQYALAAARGAVADGGRPDAVPAERRGLLLATGTGLAALFEAMDATVTEEGAAALSPATAPYFAVNVLGNRLAAEFGLKGFSLTVATAGTAAVDALSAGALALAAGRCDSLVLAATEEPLPPGRGGGGQQGSVVFTLEPPAAARSRGARVHGTVRARSLFLPPGALRDFEGRSRAAGLLAGALTDLLGERTRDDSVDVHLDLDGSTVSEAVALAVAGATTGAGRTALGSHPTAPAGAPGTGLPAGAAGAGCLGGALAVAHAVTAPHGPERLVVCASGAGHVALVRVVPSPSSTGAVAC